MFVLTSCITQEAASRSYLTDLADRHVANMLLITSSYLGFIKNRNSADPAFVMLTTTDDVAMVSLID